jgi:excinuclease ABC subunit B
VQRTILDMRGSAYDDYVDVTATPKAAEKTQKYIADVKVEDIPKTILDLKRKMHAAAEDLDFEKAADLRDRVKALEAIELAMR